MFKQKIKNIITKIVIIIIVLISLHFALKFTDVNNINQKNYNQIVNNQPTQNNKFNNENNNIIKQLSLYLDFSHYFQLPFQYIAT